MTKLRDILNKWNDKSVDTSLVPDDEIDELEEALRLWIQKIDNGQWKHSYIIPKDKEEG